MGELDPEPKLMPPFASQSHWYRLTLPSGSLELLPFTVTDTPWPVVYGPPAFATGDMLVTVTEKESVWQAPSGSQTRSEPVLLLLSE